jgi:membrane protein DedA with SNARE-associated domain
MIKKFLFIAALFFVTFGAHAAATTEVVPVSNDSLSFIGHVEEWYKSNTNYFSITVLMAAESSILPVPSEMVIPPAVYVAMDPKSSLSIVWIIFFGTLGAMIGATFNYLMSMWLGRLVVYKFADSKLGKLLMLSSEKIKKSEKFFNDHGKTSTFIGRLIPVVRHLISIPAGLAKMNYLNFLLYTFLGAGLWNIVLALLGYVAGANRDMINKYSHELSYVFVGIGAILLIWLIVKNIRKKNNPA